MVAVLRHLLVIFVRVDVPRLIHQTVQSLLQFNPYIPVALVQPVGNVQDHVQRMQIAKVPSNVCNELQTSGYQGVQGVVP